MTRNVAVVVGALGVIGRYIVERLLAEEDWEVVGLSRRAAPETPRYRHIPVDLLDEEAAIDDEPKPRPAIFEPVTFDSSDPDVTALGVLGLPAEKGKKNQLLRGKPLTLYARVEDEQSGIKEVVFFVGKPTAEGGLPAGVEPVPGVLAPADPKAKGDAKEPMWLAQLPVPTDKPGKVPVGSMLSRSSAKVKMRPSLVTTLIRP